MTLEHCLEKTHIRQNHLLAEMEGVGFAGKDSVVGGRE